MRNHTPKSEIEKVAEDERIVLKSAISGIDTVCEDDGPLWTLRKNEIITAEEMNAEQIDEARRLLEGIPDDEGAPES